MFALLARAPGAATRSLRCTDFTEYAVGIQIDDTTSWGRFTTAPASGFTVVSNNTSLSGKQVEVSRTTGQARNAIYLNLCNGEDEGNCMFRFKIVSWNNGSNDAAATMIMRWGDSLGCFVDIGKVSGSQRISVLNFPQTDNDRVAISFNTSTYYWLRGNVTGNTFQAKVWANGTAEPAAYQVSLTGSAGIGNTWGISAGSNGSITTVDWFAFSAGTNVLAPFPTG